MPPEREGAWRPPPATKTRLSACAFLALAGLAFVFGVRLAARPPAHPLEIVFLDVGQGDATFVESPSGTTFLVDAGRTTPGDDMGRRVVVPFLRARGLSRIDDLLLTHADDDHIGGAATILTRVTVGRLLIPATLPRTAAVERVLTAARARRVPVTDLRAGMRLDTPDGVVATVLNPDPEGPPSQNDNDDSVVLRLGYGATSVLLTGDAGGAVEDRLLRSGTYLRCDVLKLAHHGSNSASTSRFLDAVHPAVAVASAGRRNLYGHPHPAVLARLQQRGIRVLRTDLCGAVIARSDGQDVWFRAQRGSPACGCGR